MINKYIFSISYQSNQILENSTLYGHDLSIVCEECDDRPPYCLFTSPNLNSLTDPSEIWSRALSLMSLYNGATNLSFQPDNEHNRISNLEITQMYIWKTYEEITPSKKNEITQSYPFDTNLILEERFLLKNNRMAYLINLAKTEKDLLTILLQLGNGLNWVNLYSIYDTIKTYSNQIKKNHFNTIINHAEYTENDVKAFTGTANNYGLLGVDARHGELGFGVPQRVLSLKESQKLIISLCNSYINNKFY